jgi:phosphoglycerate dehydrogenase-like enzyme
MDVTLVGLEELFRVSDVVSIHAPSLETTRGMITGDLIASMKPGATLINTARGAVVHEAELLAVAERRPDLQFVLDVTDPEPPVAGSSIFTLPNVVYTPHIAGSRDRECRRMGALMLEELKRYLAGQPLQWVVTRDMERRMA